MIEKLLQRWAELQRQVQHGRKNKANVIDKANQEIEIAERLQELGYPDTLDGLSLERTIASRKRVLGQMLG